MHIRQIMTAHVTVQLNLNFTHVCWYTRVATRLMLLKVQNSTYNFIWHATVACALVPLTWHGTPEMHYIRTCICTSQAHNLFDALNVRRYAYTLHYARNCISQV